MLVDVEFDRPNPAADLIAHVWKRPAGPTRLQRGVYLFGHWNPERSTSSSLRSCEYGVCDSAEQLLASHDYEADPRKLLISLVEMRKEDQSESGGWRWHKWGKYIGTQSPQCEYLYDEPEIELVYTFNVYEIL